MGVEVRPVVSRADLRRFVKYPFEIYHNDPHWVPPLILEEKRRFDPRKNPFYEHARMDLFLAERDGKTVGRVAAIDDDNHNATHDDNLSFFGFFEAADEDVAAELFGRVEGWAQNRGRDAVRGPANPNMNEGSGFQVNAFDTDPFVLMPYNPPEYPEYAEAAGYGKVKDLHAYIFESEWEVGEKMVRVAERVRRRHALVVRPANMRRLGAELKLLKQVFNEGWVQNWGFVRYTDAEFDRLVRELRLIVDPDLILFVEIGGRTAGVALCIPDANQVLKRARGRLFPGGIIAYLNRKNVIDQFRMVILGLLPEWRGKGLEAVMIDEIYKNALRKGYRRCELSWVLEDNRAIIRGLEASGTQLYKVYRLYQRDL